MLNRNRGQYRLLNRYVGREYLLSFIVSFVFFFFIFFVNQILVLAQKILLKNVSVMMVLELVILSIPQFLMYTMPFSSLASASMVIGNLSSQNEILALRSSGIKLKNVFLPIFILSLVLSGCTFLIADRMIPYTAQRYRELYAQVLVKLPSLELSPYSSTQFSNRVISNGDVQGSHVKDVMIFDDSNTKNSKVISSKESNLELIDLDRLIYKIELKEPSILIRDSSSVDSYSISQASDMTLYLKLNNNNSSSYSSITPSQMSINDLKDAIKEKEEENNIYQNEYEMALLDANYNVADNLLNLEKKDATNEDIISLVDSLELYDMYKDEQSFSFYYQYYKSELQKKIALSLACTILIFIAFPISFFKVKYGRLIGFGLSMLIACIYWFFLYFVHTRAILYPINPAYFMWLPNIVVFVIGCILLIRLRKAR